MSEPRIVISVVSHGQADLVKNLLTDIGALCDGNIRIVLTLNVPEVPSLDPKGYRYPIEMIMNERPRGFGTNHNSAFRRVPGDYFCVVNPDIRFTADPFRPLLECLQDTDAALAGPLVISPQGSIEDSARRFPTPFRIARKLFLTRPNLDYKFADRPLSPDWIGGMFMFFRSVAFQELGGFDERYFLYYEDVDLCARLRLSGQEVVICPRAAVIHAARRESRRNLKYLKWHISSMLRFFFSAVFARLIFQRLLTRRRAPG